MPTLLLDARCLGEKTHGIARYTEELLRHFDWPLDWKLLVLYMGYEYSPWFHPNYQWIPTNIGPLSIKNQALWHRLKKQHSIDLVHLPSFIRPLHLPFPWLMTLHDLIHIEFSQEYTRAHRLYYAWLKQSLIQAKGVLTVSHTSQSLIEKWAPKAPKPQVTYLGSGLIAQKKPSPASPYYLYVGNKKSHKGFDILFEAFLKLNRFKLKVVGLNGPSHPHVSYQSDLSDKELSSLYMGAEALILPSLQEGFGLPLLEAMKLKTPVIVSEISVFKEIAGPTATYFEAGSAPALIDAIEIWEKKTGADKENQTEAAYTRAQKYTWKTSAARTLEVYRACI